MANDNISLQETQPIALVSEPKTDTELTVTDPKLLKQALIEKVKSLMNVRGEISLPCVPAVLDEYLQLVHNLLKTLGQNLTDENLNNLKELIVKGLTEGYKLSPHARLLVSFLPADEAKGLASGVTINTKVLVESVADKYQKWPEIRQEPLFGTHPDAKVMAIAAQLGEPETTKILDIGAGTGRNTIPLAKLGHPVDAIELTPAFIEKLTTEINNQNLPVNLFQGDILEPLLRMKVAHYKLAIASEVLSHFRYIDQVRLFFAKMCDTLRSGGLLLFSAFLAVNDYEPDNFVKEMSEVSWSYIITRKELKTAMEDLPLELISDESVIEYEQKHLPPEAWPPTTWYVNWAMGRDLFPISKKPPMELRWILLKRI
ncbi:class I SAM-dependent methyltransferase [Phormidium sp. LEGE 05292]|uniref:class I SAM-dependent methyltransferase n=1 Tax=[Phormidium] sp. LEGE 05292 TaxID=767427 RepID=UPI0018811B59|nr:class I SAM-dependent methyltransferase [Phormidium sp. LEGE 05292]MBE9228650.1 class I SAM-dependent methyltransferase [Phormidium sp. LEGE 05292]